MAPSRERVADAATDQRNGRNGECFICQMRAQKHVANHGAGHIIFWVELTYEAPVAKPRAVAAAPLPSWHIRAP